MYNDSSGEFIFTALAAWLGSKLLAAAVIGAAIGVASYTVGLAVTGNINQWSLGGALKSAFWGGIGGAVSFGVGEIFNVASQAGKLTQIGTLIQKSVGDVGLAIVQAGTHAVSQGVLSVMQGGDFVSSVAGSFFGSLGASAFGAIAGDFASSAGGTIAFGALSGGIGAELSGGNFWEGAVIGGIVAGLNHAMHRVRISNNTFEYEFNEINNNDPEFFEKLRKHYENKTGKEFILTKEEFNYLMKKAISENLIDFKKAKCFNGNCSAIVNFYNSKSNDLKLSFGRATVKFYYKNNTPIPNGFYDKYDFDSKPWGQRSILNEIITRGYNIYSSGKSFEIKYP